MIAVDTCVLLDIFFDDPSFGQSSADALRRCLRAGSVVACPVVWAETRAAFNDDESFTQTMSSIGLGYAAFDEGTAILSGSIWQAYRRAGGKRDRIMADFLIGAHALHHSARLLTRDAGFYRDYFSGLLVETP